MWNGIHPVFSYHVEHPFRAFLPPIRCWLLCWCYFCCISTCAGSSCCATWPLITCVGVSWFYCRRICSRKSSKYSLQKVSADPARQLFVVAYIKCFKTRGNDILHNEVVISRPFLVSSACLLLERFCCQRNASLVKQEIRLLHQVQKINY